MRGRLMRKKIHGRLMKEKRAHVLEPQVRPEVDLSKVNLGVGNVGGEVLAGDAGVSIARVVLHIGIVLTPETLVSNCDQIVGIHCLGVVGHDLDPGLQHKQRYLSIQAEAAVLGELTVNIDMGHMGCQAQGTCCAQCLAQTS